MASRFFDWIHPHSHRQPDGEYTHYSGLWEPALLLAFQVLGIAVGISELLSWARQAPPGTTIPAASLVDVLAAEENGGDTPPVSEPSPTPPPTTWADQLWLVPAERRIGARELAQALGRSRSWVYGRLTGEGAIPHAKLDGELTFKAGEVRAWLRGTEEVVREGPMESTPPERRLTLARSAS